MDILVILLIVSFILAFSCVKIVPQAKSYVVERLGSYHQTWGNGVHFLIPFIDRIAGAVTLKEVVKDFAPQPVITKDNVTIDDLLVRVKPYITDEGEINSIIKAYEFAASMHKEQFRKSTAQKASRDHNRHPECERPVHLHAAWPE